MGKAKGKETSTVSVFLRPKAKAKGKEKSTASAAAVFSPEQITELERLLAQNEGAKHALDDWLYTRMLAQNQELKRLIAKERVRWYITAKGVENTLVDQAPEPPVVDQDKMKADYREMKYHMEQVENEMKIAPNWTQEEVLAETRSRVAAARTTVLQFGKYKGKMMEQVALAHPAYAKWFLSRNVAVKHPQAAIFKELVQEIYHHHKEIYQHRRLQAVQAHAAHPLPSWLPMKKA